MPTPTAEGSTCSTSSTSATASNLPVARAALRPAVDHSDPLGLLGRQPVQLHSSLNDMVDGQQRALLGWTFTGPSVQAEKPDTILTRHGPSRCPAGSILLGRGRRVRCCRGVIYNTNARQQPAGVERPGLGSNPSSPALLVSPITSVKQENTRKCHHAAAMLSLCLQQLGRKVGAGLRWRCGHEAVSEPMSLSEW
jgi:hypothetical protein